MLLPESLNRSIAQCTEHGLPAVCVKVKVCFRVGGKQIPGNIGETVIPIKHNLNFENCTFDLKCLPNQQYLCNKTPTVIQDHFATSCSVIWLFRYEVKWPLIFWAPHTCSQSWVHSIQGWTFWAQALCLWEVVCWLVLSARAEGSGSSLCFRHLSQLFISAPHPLFCCGGWRAQGVCQGLPSLIDRRSLTK